MKNVYFFIVGALVCTAIVTGCGKNPKETPKPDDPKIEIPVQDKTQTAFADEKTTGELNFTAHEAWSIDVSELTLASEALWIRLYLNGVETYSGPAGEIVLEVRVDPNYSGQAREAQIVINSAGEQVAVSVTQSATTQSGEVPEDPDPNGHTARLTAHVWHHVRTTEADDPEYQNRDAYTMTFGADGTASSTKGEGWSGVPFAVSGDELTLGEGDEAVVYNITILTDAQLVLADEYGTMTFSKEVPGSEEEPGFNVLDEISDAAFKAVAAGLDTDGVLTAQEAASVVSLDVSQKGIASLAGIEYFTSLTELYCKTNKLTSLDLSKNTKLTTLYCDDNLLSSLDVSKCTSLTELSCPINQLASLDVLRCMSLTFLSCPENRLTSLDVSNNKGLKELWAGWNQLTSLDVSGNASLQKLTCNDNRLSSLDISNNSGLTLLVVYNNPGDGKSTFPITGAWFDNSNIPANFTAYNQWEYGGATITVDYGGEPDPADADPMALLTAHAWKQVSWSSVTDNGSGEPSEEAYDDMDATFTFNADGTLTATGPDQDVFTDYFGLDPLPTYSLSEGKFILTVNSSSAMILSYVVDTPADVEFDVVTLTDNELELSGRYVIQLEGYRPYITDITMKFVK